MTKSALPTSLYDQTGLFTEHVRHQPVKRWCTFTLAYPRWSNRLLWETCLRKTFREFENRVLRGRLAKQNAATGATSIRRVVTIGGNPDEGIRYHGQGIIDWTADDGYLIRELTNAWHKNVRRMVQAAGHKFYAKEAMVYAKQLDHQVARHLHYLFRHEDSKVGWGVDKVLGRGVSYLTETNGLPFD